MSNQRRTWIAVADSANSEVLQYYTADHEVELVDNSVMSRDVKSNQELVTTKRGRVFQSVGSGRSAMERPTEPKDHENEKFARRLGNFLSKNVSRYDRLFIAASPTMLGELRKSLSHVASDKVTMTLDKNLTRLERSEVPKQFSPLINSTIYSAT